MKEPNSAAATTTFAIIPGDDELASIDREIAFFPSPPIQPHSLEPDAIERWNRDGYLGPIDVFTKQAADELREYFDDLLQRTLAAGGDSYSISSAHLKHARIFDLLTHPAIVGPVVDLLGDDVIGWGSHFFCKLPGDGKSVDWHQDCSYWPLTPTKSVTVWLAIDDAEADNGCMEVFLGSHRHGLIGFERSDDDSQNVLNQTIHDPERFGTWNQTPIRAGQMSIHSDLLVHGSSPNDSDRRRCGLTLRYCPADVTAHLGWNAKGVVVSGRADPDRWPGASRPPNA